MLGGAPSCACQEWEWSLSPHRCDGLVHVRSSACPPPRFLHPVLPKSVPPATPSLRCSWTGAPRCPYPRRTTTRGSLPGDAPAASDWSDPRWFGGGGGNDPGGEYGFPWHLSPRPPTIKYQVSSIKVSTLSKKNIKIR